MKCKTLLNIINAAALAFDEMLETVITPQGFDPNALKPEDLPQACLYLLRMLPIVAVVGVSTWFIIACAFCL